MNKPSLKTARFLALSFTVGLLAGAQASAQRQINTPLALPNTLQLKLQTLPNFGTTPIFRPLTGEAATRFLNGNTTWLTAATLNANRANIQQLLNRDLQAVQANQRPEFQPLLGINALSALREPLLTVQTKSGPLTIKLMSPAVGLRAAADSVRENRANNGQAQLQTLARSLQLSPAALTEMNQAARSEGPGVKRADRMDQTLTLVQRNSLGRLGDVLKLLEAQGTADHLDTYNPGSCSPNPNSLFSKASFPLKPLLPEVKSQGGRGTCWAFATVGAAEITIRRDYKQYVNLSEEDYVGYTKVMYRTPDSGDGDWPDDAMKLNAQNNYRFALENAWQYNKSFQRTETETPANSGKWLYTHSCADYPFQNQCEDTVSQAETGCITTAGKTVCGAQLAQARTPYGLNTAQLNNFWDWKNKDYSLYLAAYTLSGHEPVLLLHDARYLQADSRGFAGDLPFNMVNHQNANGQWVANTGPQDVNWWNHVAVLVGFISNSELKKILPDAPPAPTLGYFIMKNSWGNCWADGGYIYLSWDWMRKYAGGLTSGVKITKS